MSRTNGQLIINYHTSGTSLPSASNVELGEVVVLHNPDKVELVIKDNNGTLHEFVESASVISIAQEVLSKSGSTYSADEKTITKGEGNVFAAKTDVAEGVVSYDSYSAFSGSVLTTLKYHNDVLSGVTNAVGEVVKMVNNAVTSANTHSDGALSAYSGSVDTVYLKKADSAHTHAISEVTGLQAALDGKANSATTLAGYGITDAKIANNVITLGTNSITVASSADTHNAIAAATASGLTGVSLNGVDFTVTDKKAEGTIYASGISLGSAIVYSGVTLATATDNVVGAISAVTSQMVDNELTTAAALNALNGKFADYATSADTTSALNNKVDKVSGKDLSTNDYTTAEKNKLATIAASAQVNTIETIKVNGSAVTPSNKVVDITIPAASEYTLSAKTASEGAAKSYALYKDGVQVGDTIDIAKDMFVSSGGVVTVGTDKYVRLYLANSANTYVDIAVSDLAHVYTGESAITISDGDVVSLKLDTTQGNVTLSQSSNGLKASVDLSSYATYSALSAYSGSVDTVYAKKSEVIASATTAVSASTAAAVTIAQTSKSATTNGLKVVVTTQNGSVSGVEFNGTTTSAISASTAADADKLDGHDATYFEQALTFTDSSTIDFTRTGNEITATVIKVDGGEF